MPSNSVHPLASVQILRWGNSLSGDFLQALLSDAGATVTHAAALRAPALAAALRTADVLVNDLGRGNALPQQASQALSDRPHLVGCALVSFPAGGPQGLPELEDDPVLAVLGVNRMLSDRPRHEPLRMPSLYAAQMAALYIACALLQRGRGVQQPQHIEVSLFGAALNVLGRQLVTFDDASLRDPLSYGWRLPVAQPRRCADGRYIQPHGMFAHFVRILMTVGGHPEWADEAADGLFHLPDAAAVQLWNTRMDKMFLQRDAAQWEQMINAAGGACTMCRTAAEWAGEAHAHTAGIVRSGMDKADVQPGPGVTLFSHASDAAPSITPAPLPEVMPGTPPLSGMRVVDFCIIIAGPTVGRVLADLGADVVKIDAPNRYVNPCLWMDVNRGKRSIVLDLRKNEAREVASRFVAGADVVVENFRAGKLEALGFGYDAVASVRPGIVYASTNAMDALGPWANRPGWEHNAQAATGMQWARSQGIAPEHVPFPVNDYATGLFGALGIVLALLHRKRTGHGSRVLGSLARSASYLQRFDAPYAVRKPRLQVQTFQCSDGWVSAYCAADDDQAGAVQRTLFGARSAGLTCDALVADLGAHGWPAVRENAPADMLRQAWLRDAGLIVQWTHPTLGPLLQGSPHGISSAWQFVPGHPAPEPGADAESLLGQIGLGAMAGRLRENKVVCGFPLFPAPMVEPVA